MAWQKGESGNPAGRPKEGTGLMDIIRREIPHEDITQALKKLLAAGDPKTAQYLADRELGRPAQAVHITGDAEKPLHMLVGVEGRNLAPQLAQDEAESPPEVIEGETVPLDVGDGAVRYLEEGS